MILRARQFTFHFPGPALVMGIVYVTPDSFSDGGQFLDPDAAVAHALDVSRERQRVQQRKSELAARKDSLTERELSVARLVAQGRINAEIAQDMGIALRTVKFHRQRVMEKLQAQTVADLVRISDEAGL